MRHYGILVATTALLLASVGAEAAVLASAPAEGYPSAQTISCNIVSVNTGPREVTTEILNYGGDVLANDTVTLSPNEGHSLASASGYAAWCRFTVIGSTKLFRAVAVYDDGGTYTVAIPAQ
jgi:hypothetical protein